MKLLLISLLFATGIVRPICCQTSVAYYGNQTNGVELSISVSNNIIVAGGTNVVQFQIRNGITNFVYFETIPERLIEVSLIDESGYVIKLSRFRQDNPGGGPVIGLKPDEAKHYEKILPVSLTNKQGKYRLRAEMYMYSAIQRPVGNDSGERFFKPASNTLDIQVTKPGD